MSAPTDPTVMLLRSFCLATMAGQYEEVMRRAEKDGWSHRQVLRHRCESEAVERGHKLRIIDLSIGNGGQVDEGSRQLEIFCFRLFDLLNLDCLFVLNIALAAKSTD